MLIKERMKITNNKPLEDLILGYILFTDESERVELLSVLTEKDFFEPKNRKLYNYLKQNISPTFLEVCADHQNVGVDQVFLSGILNPDTTEQQTRNNIAILKDVTAKRELELMAVMINDLVSKDKVDEAIQKVDTQLVEILADKSIDSGKLTSLRGQYHEMQNDKDALRTGFTDLDDRFEGGLKRGEMWVVGGRSGGGKSMWVTDFTARQVAHDYNCLFFSTELTGATAYGFFARPFAKHTMSEVGEAVDELATYPNLKIYSKIRTVEGILGEVKKQMLRSKVDLFVVDHLQALEFPEKEEQYVSLTRAIIRIKRFCNDNDLRAIVCSQLSRAGMASKDEMAYSFLGSGKIEQECDGAFVLAREYDKDTKEHTNTTAVYIQKNRRVGRTGVVYLVGDPNFKSYTQVNVV
jgi:replicative DNA helicase